MIIRQRVRPKSSAKLRSKGAFSGFDVNNRERFARNPKMWQWLVMNLVFKILSYLPSSIFGYHCTSYGNFRVPTYPVWVAETTSRWRNSLNLVAWSILRVVMSRKYTSHRKSVVQTFTLQLKLIQSTWWSCPWNWSDNWIHTQTFIKTSPS